MLASISYDNKDTFAVFFILRYVHICFALTFFYLVKRQFNNNFTKIIIIIVDNVLKWHMK